jgi:hypothetical protein
MYPPSVMEKIKNHVSFLAYKNALGGGIFRSKCPLWLCLRPALVSRTPWLLSKTFFNTRSGR